MITDAEMLAAIDRAVEAGTMVRLEPGMTRLPPLPVPPWLRTEEDSFDPPDDDMHWT